MSEPRRIAVTTAVFGTATAVSRVAGVVREIMVAGRVRQRHRALGVQHRLQPAQPVRAVVADNAISGAFIPVFVELRERGEEREAWRVAGMVLWTTAILLRAHGPADAAGAVVHPAVPGRRTRLQRPGRDADPDPVPDRDRAGHDRRRHRHPQRRPGLRAARLRAGDLEPGHHRQPGLRGDLVPGEPPGRDLRRGRAGGHHHPVPDPAAAAAGPLGAGLPARLRQPACAPRAEADAAGVDGAGPDQLQPDHRPAGRHYARTATRCPTSTSPFACSCCPRACSRWRSPPCCFPRSRGGRPARAARAWRMVGQGLRTIVFLLLPAAAVSA